MSELSVRQYLHNDGSGLTWGYDKSEADKVIAELEESHKKEVEQLLILNREQANAANRLRDSMEQALRHHKYKRCMAMADACENEEKRLDAIAPLFETDKECWEYNSDYWNKWYKRWLAIASKFKEAK